MARSTHPVAIPWCCSSLEALDIPQPPAAPLTANPDLRLDLKSLPVSRTPPLNILSAVARRLDANTGSQPACLGLLAHNASAAVSSPAPRLISPPNPSLPIRVASQTTARHAGLRHLHRLPSPDGARHACNAAGGLLPPSACGHPSPLHGRHQAGEPAGGVQPPVQLFLGEETPPRQR